MDDKNKVVKVMYSKSFKSKNDSKDEVVVSVEFVGKTKFDWEQAAALRKDCKQKIEEYFEKEFNPDKDDIISIIEKVREVTSHLEEKNLDVNVHRGDSEYYGEYAFYENGFPVRCGMCKHIWDDIIIIKSEDTHTDVRFKQYGFHLSSREQVSLLKEMLDDYYNRVIRLNNLTKDNEEVNSLEVIRILELTK